MFRIASFNLASWMRGTRKAIVVVGSPDLRPHPALRGPSFGIPLGILKNRLNTWIPFVSKAYRTLEPVRSVQVEIVLSHLRMWLSCGQPCSYWLTVARFEKDVHSSSSLNRFLSDLIRLLFHGNYFFLIV